MAIPKVSDLIIQYAGKLINKTHLTNILTTIVNWLTDGSAELNVSKITASTFVGVDDFTFTAEAGETIAADKYVRMHSDGKLYLATNATVVGQTNKVGITTTGGVSGDTLTVETHVKTGLSGLTAGAQYYLGTSGDMTATRPTDYAEPIAIALSTTSVMILRHSEISKNKSGTTANLGIKLDSGVFSVTGRDGTALSATNPGYVSIASKANPGQTLQVAVTADQSFNDDSHASSEIINNLFGVTTSVAWGSDMPFFIYAVLHDDEDQVAFMISRLPHFTTSPVEAEIGAPDDAVADEEFSFFSFDSIDESKYNGNPCVCIGSIRMQMSSSDDWTVQTLGNSDGIGKFQEGVEFDMPTGQNGAASSKYFNDDGGTAPGFTVSRYKYNVKFNGEIVCNAAFDNCNVAGATGGNLILTTPFIKVASSGASLGLDYGSGAFNNSGTYTVAIIHLRGDDKGASLMINGGTANLNNTDIGSADDLFFQFQYRSEMA